MAAMSGDSEDGHAVATELRPADAAMFTPAAPFVVMDHHPCPDWGEVRRNAGTDSDDHAAGLVTRDRKLARRNGSSGSPVVFQVTAAHAGSLDGNDHLACTRHGIRKRVQRQLSVAEKHHATHQSGTLREI
jgi:hypothetical protein